MANQKAEKMPDSKQIDSGSSKEPISQSYINYPPHLSLPPMGGEGFYNSPQVRHGRPENQGRCQAATSIRSVRGGNLVGSGQIRICSRCFNAPLT
jgi:hypothetical protein